MAEPASEREARKKYMHQRQTRVFSILAVILAVLAIVCSLLFFYTMKGAAKTSDQRQLNFGTVLPCAPKDANANPAKYVDNQAVKVRVLNGTKFAGFARAVGEALGNRRFNINSVSNYNSQRVPRTTIRFGSNAIYQAYTLASNFNDAVMVMDDRQDDLVDVILGATFSNLRDTKSVPAAGSTIKNRTGCKAASSMKKLPKAIPHQQ